MSAIIVFILILFMPAAFLPVALKSRFSSDELDEMGICLEKPEAVFPLDVSTSIQGYELVGLFPSSNECSNVHQYVWEISERLQICQ